MSVIFIPITLISITKNKQTTKRKQVKEAIKGPLIPVNNTVLQDDTGKICVVTQHILLKDSTQDFGRGRSERRRRRRRRRRKRRGDELGLSKLFSPLVSLPNILLRSRQDSRTAHV